MIKFGEMSSFRDWDYFAISLSNSHIRIVKRFENWEDWKLRKTPIYAHASPEPSTRQGVYIPIPNH